MMLNRRRANRRCWKAIWRRRELVFFSRQRENWVHDATGHECAPQGCFIFCFTRCGVAIFSGFAIGCRGGRDQLRCSRDMAPTGDLSAPSYACGATLLSDGNVLLAGRAGNSDSTNSEIYEVATEKWMLKSPLNEQHFGHTLRLLADGNSTYLKQRRTTRLILSSANSSPVRGNGA